MRCIFAFFHHNEHCYRHHNILPQQPLSPRSKFNIMIHCCKITFSIDWAFPVRGKVGKQNSLGWKVIKNVY